MAEKKEQANEQALKAKKAQQKASDKDNSMIRNARELAQSQDRDAVLQTVCANFKPPLEPPTITKETVDDVAQEIYDWWNKQSGTKRKQVNNGLNKVLHPDEPDAENAVPGYGKYPYYYSPHETVGADALLVFMVTSLAVMFVCCSCTVLLMGFVVGWASNHYMRSTVSPCGKRV